MFVRPAFRESSKSAGEGSQAHSQAGMPLEYLLNSAYCLDKHSASQSASTLQYLSWMFVKRECGKKKKKKLSPY